jgi:nicotinate-nucleotide adenylyltransferase
MANDEGPMTKRIGIFGGSFDPVHYGHLLLAESAREQCRLDQVWLLPAAMPPHKRDQDLAPAKARLEMLQLAVAGREEFIISTLELDRGGVSYTVDTLATVRAQQPDAELFLVLGADMLHDLPSWREPARILELAIPAVARRAAMPEPDFGVLANLVSPEQLKQIRNHQIQMPLIDINSSEIRRRIAAGLSIRYRTPRAVEKYIETHGLYAYPGSRRG